MRSPVRASILPNCGGGWQQPSLPRMPAHDDGATHSGAGVRKPPTKPRDVGRGGASGAMGISSQAVRVGRTLKAFCGRDRAGWRA
jgi:hypothetical protein